MLSFTFPCFVILFPSDWLTALIHKNKSIVIAIHFVYAYMMMTIVNDYNNSDSTDYNTDMMVWHNCTIAKNTTIQNISTPKYKQKKMYAISIFSIFFFCYGDDDDDSTVVIFLAGWWWTTRKLLKHNTRDCVVDQEKIWRQSYLRLEVRR